MSTMNGSRLGFLALFYLGCACAILQTAAAQDAAPVIDSVTFRNQTERYEVVFPEFHFHDPSGTTKFIHREVIATDSPKPLNLRDGVVSISSEQQIKGATYVGGWHCGPETYYVTLQAFMMNLAGQKSNVVEYTIHCNGG